MPEVLLSDGSVQMQESYTVDPANPADARKLVTVGQGVKMIADAMPLGGLRPAVINTFTIPDGRVLQETVVLLDLAGTAPFVVTPIVPVEMSASTRIILLPGGSVELHMIPPNEGNTANVTKQIGITVWNAHPSTGENSPVSSFFTWTVKPTATTDASWGATSESLPDAEVDAQYVWYADQITGDGPFTITRTGGDVTVADLAAAGLAIRQASITSPSTQAAIIGNILRGAEGSLLRRSIQLGLTGITGVTVNKMFPLGILVRRAPSTDIQSIPTVTTASGSFSFASHLYGFPTAHIRLGDGVTLPTGFVLDQNVLTWSGLSTNFSSGDLAFVISNGYHPDVPITLRITVNIAAFSGSFPGSAFSMTKNSRANDGVLMSTLGDGDEVVGWFDLASGTIKLSVDTAAGVAHLGGAYRTAGNYIELRNGQSETRRSLGLLMPIGLGPKYLILTLRMPDTQPAGKVCIAVMGPSQLLFEKDGGGGGLDRFILKTGTAEMNSTAIDAIGNFINLLVYVANQNQAGMAYATDGTIDGDTNLQTVANIDSAWDRLIFCPSFTDPATADVDLQSVSLGLGLLT